MNYNFTILNKIFSYFGSRRFLLKSLIAVCVLTMTSSLRAAESMGTQTSSGLLTTLTSMLNGVTVLKADMPEDQVRNKISKGKSGEVFFIESGASWTLTATLKIPEGVTILGTHPGGGRGNVPTFIKGFDGPLATLERFTTLHGIYFDGNKKEYAGDGMIAGGDKKEGVREVRMIRVEIRNNRGDGYVMSVPHYFSEFNFCSFDRNDGYGVVYGEVRSHHTDNVWNSCHWGWNGKGGVAFHGVENSSIWENCEFFHNGGAAFDHFLINKKRGNGKEIGPRPGVGAGALVIRNTVIRNSAGPVWLNRGGQSEAIVFEDCRLKHNGNPSDSALTKDSGKTVNELFDLTGPVSGLFHVEQGQLFVEIRGGFAWDNGEYIFTASPRSEEGSRIQVGGAASNHHITGGVYAPNGYATILDTNLLPEGAPMVVKGGIGLNPMTGEVVNYTAQQMKLEE